MKKTPELSYLRCPKLYCPVKRRGDKKMWEVYRSNCCMAVDTCDWSLVSFKHLTDSSFAVSEYTTKVNWFGNQTLKCNLNTATRRFCCLIWMLPHCKRLHHSRVTEDPGLKTDLKVNMYFLLTLSAKIYPRDRRLIQVSVHTFKYVVLQAIATSSIHTKNKSQSQE